MTYAEIKSSVEDANGCKNGKSAGKIIWINYKKVDIIWREKMNGMNVIKKKYYLCIIVKKVLKIYAVS